jgi:hypothetical protein
MGREIGAQDGDCTWLRLVRLTYDRRRPSERHRDSREYQTLYLKIVYDIVCVHVGTRGPFSRYLTASCRNEEARRFSSQPVRPYEPILRVRSGDSLRDQAWVLKKSPEISR